MSSCGAGVLRSDPKPTIRRMAGELGVHPEALRNWIGQDEAGHGKRDGRLPRRRSGSWPSARRRRHHGADRHRLRRPLKELTENGPPENLVGRPVLQGCLDFDSFSGWERGRHFVSVPGVLDSG
ncbi:transposase [Streptomyces sp. NPDC086023]|uniref:transposase n=1 Tax=Streptomyces sp. NPDC086023 TaxID=3365746 RepID=UPI0037D33B51